MSNAKCSTESGGDAPNRISVRDDKPRNQLKIVALCTRIWCKALVLDSCMDFTHSVSIARQGLESLTITNEL